MGNSVSGCTQLDGKTFLAKVILVQLRGQGKIVLVVAPFEIAVTLLPGDKTAETMLKVPIDLNISVQPVCGISLNAISVINEKYRVEGRVTLEEDEYFMGLASWEAKRSKDPHFQVGAIVVNNDNEIISRGYNCWAKGNNYPYNKAVKKLIITHAEFNAILNAPEKVKDCRIYVTLFPCNECAKLVIQSGIKSVIFSSDEKGDRNEYKASRRMLEDAGIDIRQQVSPLVYTESELTPQGNSDDEKTQQNNTCYEPPKKIIKNKVSNKK